MFSFDTSIMLTTIILSLGPRMYSQTGRAITNNRKIFSKLSHLYYTEYTVYSPDFITY